MSEFVISKRDLSNYFINNGKDILDLKKYLQYNFHLTDTKLEAVASSIDKNFLSKFNNRWAKACRTKDRFEKNNKQWLDSEFKVMFDEEQPSLSGERGRPSKPYDESSEKTRKRKNMMLFQEYGFAHLQNAYVQALRTMGKLDEASLVVMMRTLSKEKKRKIVKEMSHETGTITSYSTQEALCIYIDLDLSKYQYSYMRSCLAEKNCSIFPSYQMLTQAKQLCYPPKRSITIIDIAAKVQLQDLLDHTVARILQIDSIYKPGSRNLKLFTKWGCDGSSGQNEYKQILLGENEVISDANLFIASIVPLKLINQDTNEVVWQNQTCSSVRCCRPILIEFSKETPDKTRAVVNDIRTQINHLQATLLNKNDEGIQIQHELFLTMIDGKIAQVLTETSSSAVCTVCGAKPKEMNDLIKLRSKPENESAYEYGLSTLHAWIRCMELILHISYNLSFKKWSATTPENKKSKDDKKKYVQNRFRAELGLHVDKPRQGTGNSNDGNTARRFFQNHQCSADITGVDEELIKRFYVILQTLSSGMSINAEKFGKYSFYTAKLYVLKYRWYYMPSSVHKILLHGKAIIQHFAVLPIGQLSEDAQESRNKDYKKIRLTHSRKCSRVATNEDVFHGLLFTSDPLISSLRKPQTSILSKELLEEAKQLLENY